MIPHSPPPRRTKFEQLTQFLEAPTPQSLQEPGPDRDCTKHRVSAERQEDGSFVLFARAPTNQPGKSAPMGDLDAFLDTMIQEVKEARGVNVSDAVDAFRQSLLQCNPNGQAPTVAELRAPVRRLSALPPSDFQLRNRAKFRTDSFQQAVMKRLNALPKEDPQRDALEKAGDQLASMLFEPGDTLSLEGLSSDTIGLLLDTGLLARFADLRDGVKPLPKRLVLPVSAQSLLDRLPMLFPAMPSWIVR